MKKLGTCPKVSTLAKDDIEASSWKRLVHGNEVQFHAWHENLNFMPGMKSDDIEATARKRGAFHARHETLNVMPGMKSVET